MNIHPYTKATVIGTLAATLIWGFIFFVTNFSFGYNKQDNNEQTQLSIEEHISSEEYSTPTRNSQKMMHFHSSIQNLEDRVVMAQVALDNAFLGQPILSRDRSYYEAMIEDVQQKLLHTKQIYTTFPEEFDSTEDYTTMSNSIENAMLDIRKSLVQIEHELRPVVIKHNRCYKIFSGTHSTKTFGYLSKELLGTNFTLEYPCDAVIYPHEDKNTLHFDIPEQNIAFEYPHMGKGAPPHSRVASVETRVYNDVTFSIQTLIYDPAVEDERYGPDGYIVEDPYTFALVCVFPFEERCSSMISLWFTESSNTDYVRDLYHTLESFTITRKALSISTPEWAKAEYMLDNSVSYVNQREYFDMCENNLLFTHPRTRHPLSNYTYITFGDIRIKAPYRADEIGENVYATPSNMLTEVSEYEFMQADKVLEAVAFGDWFFVAEGASEGTCIQPYYESKMVTYEKSEGLTIESVLPKNRYGQMYRETINGITTHVSLEAGLYGFTYIAFEHKNHIYVLKTEMEYAEPGTVTKSKEIISQIELL